MEEHTRPEREHTHPQQQNQGPSVCAIFYPHVRLRAPSALEWVRALWVSDCRHPPLRVRASSSLCVCASSQCVCAPPPFRYVWPPSPLFDCLFVCLFVCLVVCLFVYVFSSVCATLLYSGLLLASSFCGFRFVCGGSSSYYSSSRSLVDGPSLKKFQFAVFQLNVEIPVSVNLDTKNLLCQTLVHCT